MSEVENLTVPLETHESWRTWLMTGARRKPVDKRRMRGANRGLKKILLEGLAGGVDGTQRWHDFSGAMVRHAVEDAMRSLPVEETRVVKLAYFGGYSNREIASEVGVTEWTVQRRLRRALAAISDQIQHGQALGRRAVYGLAALLSGRWLTQSARHAWTAAAVAGAAVVVAASQPAPGAVRGAVAPATHAAPRAAPVVAPVPSPTAPVHVSVPAAPALPNVSNLPAVKVPPIKPILKKIENLL